jgi:acyl-coenzyme A synthetase/AMP-(fatty) acid ligase
MQPRKASLAPLPMLKQLAASSQGIVADAAETIAVAALAAGHAAAALSAALRGKTIVIATERQIETVAALIHLDGVAKRIVLWPGDRPRTDIDSVIREAGADSIVTTWPLHETRAGGAPSAGSAADPAIETEWVLFTSGTTNTPKMVIHTLQSLAGHFVHVAGGKTASPDPMVWCTFYDIRRYGGLQIALRALTGGCSLVLSGDAGEMPGAVLARAGRAGVTHILGTPTHWRRALMTGEAELISPRYVRLSGEVADQMILDRLRATYAAAQIVHAFASTEGGLAFEVTDGLAGFPKTFVDRPSAARLDVRNGRLCVSSPRTASGYLQGRISRVADADGFVDTGDVVALRGDRYFFIGRRDGIINVGGQKVHPEEVEAVINLHPAVQMSRVAGRRSQITGAVVTAQIVAALDPTNELRRCLESEIRHLCRAHLPPHKVPAFIQVVAALDVSAGGKLVRTGA